MENTWQSTETSPLGNAYNRTRYHNMNQSSFWRLTIRGRSVFFHIHCFYSRWYPVLWTNIPRVQNSNLSSHHISVLTKELPYRCWFIFPYGVAHRRKNVPMPRNDKNVVFREQWLPLFASVAAWSTVLRRILNLHLGWARKNILRDWGCLSWVRDRRWHFVIYHLDGWYSLPPHTHTHSLLPTFIVVPPGIKELAE